MTNPAAEEKALVEQRVALAQAHVVAQQAVNDKKEGAPEAYEQASSALTRFDSEHPEILDAYRDRVAAETRKEQERALGSDQRG